MTKTTYKTEELLAFMIPGLEMGIRTLQDQINAIKEIMKGEAPELPAATQKVQCHNCGKPFKNLLGLKIHSLKMHKRVSTMKKRA